MTVAELIKALKKMPQDVQVYSHLPYSDQYAKVRVLDLLYTDKVDDIIDWAFPEEHADDDMNLDEYVQVVVL